MRASWRAVMKLSGVAVPSCSWGSSHREARPACQARTILLGAAPVASDARNGGAGDARAPRIRVRDTSRRALRARNRGRLIAEPPFRRAGELLESALR